MLAPGTRGRYCPSQLLSGELKKELVKNHRDLKTLACSVVEGQRCGPPASVIKQLILPLQGEEHGPVNLKVMLVWDIFFSFLLSQEQKLWGDYILYGKFLSKVLFGGWCWVDEYCCCYC